MRVLRRSDDKWTEKVPSGEPSRFLSCRAPVITAVGWLWNYEDTMHFCKCDTSCSRKGSPPKTAQWLQQIHGFRGASVSTQTCIPEKCSKSSLDKNAWTLLNYHGVSRKVCTRLWSCQETSAKPVDSRRRSAHLDFYAGFNAFRWYGICTPGRGLQFRVGHSCVRVVVIFARILQDAGIVRTVYTIWRSICRLQC